MPRFQGLFDVFIQTLFLFSLLFVTSDISAKPTHRTDHYPLSSSIPTGALANPTKAGALFCEQRPSECEVDPREPEILRLTPAIWEKIGRINREVNEQIKPLSDEKHHGVADVWNYPDDGIGDCEDYQLEKRRRLAAAGLPRRPFRLTVVIEAGGTGHMVLLARTDHGDYVLDNQTGVVAPWRHTGYEFSKRESDDPRYYLQLIPGNPTASNPTGQVRG